MPVRIELPWSTGLKMRKWGCIGATASRPLPAQGIIGEVGIDQRIPEPPSASLPG
jgi:hypothetical protein